MRPLSRSFAKFESTTRSVTDIALFYRFPLLKHSFLYHRDSEMADQQERAGHRAMSKILVMRHQAAVLAVSSSKCPRTPLDQEGYNVLILVVCLFSLIVANLPPKK